MRLPLACLLLMLTSMASAAPLQNIFGDQQEAFLPVEQAFVVSASLQDARTVRVHWDIAEGYYLYRHQLRFQLVSPPGFTLGEPQLPEGKKKTDEYFGEIEAYYHRLDAVLPIAAVAKDSLGKTLTLELRYQGCAERGLCYPPETINLPLLPMADAGLGATAPETVVSEQEQDRLAALISERNLLWISLTFFGLGLLLAFTPCVLPMLPILSGIIAGAGERAGALRGLSLAGAYVVAMAGAYTLFGVVAGLTGANLQAALQHPGVIISFSTLFVVLALSMFGLYELQLPAILQHHATRLSNRQEGGSLVGAAVMGFLSALIVGPCIAPPLAGALLYIGNTGDAMLGGLALFALGMGMGAPLLALGVVEGGLLPRSGPWMTRIKHLFGFVLLGVALWMLSRLLPGQLTTLLWAAFALSAAVYVLWPIGSRHARWRYAVALLSAGYAALMLFGGLREAVDPMKPWQALATHPGQTAERTPFLPVKTMADLELMRGEAQRQQRPVILDFYADWCVACVKMEHEVFGDAAVRAAIGNVMLLRADVTANDEQDRALLKSLGVYGPPTMIIFAADGSERTDLRLVGETDSAGFIARLHQLDGR